MVIFCSKHTHVSRQDWAYINPLSRGDKYKRSKWRNGGRVGRVVVGIKRARNCANVYFCIQHKKGWIIRMTFSVANGFRQGCLVPALAFVWQHIIKYQHGINLRALGMNSGPNKRSSVAPLVAGEPGGGWSITDFPQLPNELRPTLVPNMQLTPDKQHLCAQAMEQNSGGYISRLVITQCQCMSAQSRQKVAATQWVVIYVRFNKWQHWTTHNVWATISQ